MNSATLTLLENVQAIVETASIAVNAIYAQDFEFSLKEDGSPLTQADITAHHIICDGLQKIAPYPILSEEGLGITWQERKTWGKYWLIDPIDGTKEFIKKTGEFTINIALIENGIPILGLVSAPALQTTYIAAKKHGAWKINSTGLKTLIHVKQPQTNAWKVVGSKAHGNAEVEAFSKKLPNATLVSMGSSLKICAVAEGAADIYPRFGLTSEWDTAVAHAIVDAAGGQILTHDLMPLRYNTRNSLLNPPFIVCANRHSQWSALWKHSAKR